MELCCDLEVDVNGQEIFWVSKRILTSFSGRLSKLFSKVASTTTKNLKVIFHDFPGGAEGFELVARFCYYNGRIKINPSNIFLVCSIAHYMEMTKGLSEILNLAEQTEKSLDGIHCWTWSELLSALKQCQNLRPFANSARILDKFLDSLVAIIATADDTSPISSSPDSAGFRYSSSDTRSTESVRNRYSGATWWFEDLVGLNHDLIEKMIKALILYQKLSHVTISKFLIYYQRLRLKSAKSNEKRKITETVVDLLFSLDTNSVSCKSLFGILKVGLSLKVGKSCSNRLESMISLQLDQATLDNLLVPSPHRVEYVYDVNLVLRFLKSFIHGGGCRVASIRLKKVAKLMDMYMAEVAPDSYLKPSKFVALAMTLPDSARDSYDGIYQAIDMYLEVHSEISHEEKMQVCCALNYDKLSSEAYKHLTQNSKFPSKADAQGLISQESKLKSLLWGTDHIKPFGEKPCSYPGRGSKEKKDEDGKQNVLYAKKQEKKDEDGEQTVFYAKKLDLSMENEKLRADLRGMQWRVVELEKVCSRMQTQLGKMLNSRSSSSSNARYLPKLCS